MPWEQVVGLRDLVIGDAGNRVGEPGVGIDAVQLCRFDQGVGITVPLHLILEIESRLYPVPS